MTASEQVFADYNGAVTQSRSVDFFQSTPRWPSATTTFAFNTDYLTPVALTALLPFFFAIVAVIVLLINLIIRFTCLFERRDARLKRLQGSRRGSLMLAPLSILLLLLIFVFTSLGLLGNASLNHSSLDALDVFSGLVNDLSRTGFAVVNTTIILRSRLAAFNASDADVSAPLLGDIVGDLIRPTLKATQGFMLERYPNAVPLREVLTSIVNNIEDVFKIVRGIVGLVYSVVFTIIIILVSAPPLLRIATARSTPKVASVIAYLLFLFVPAILAWVLVGVMSAIGATVADICASLDVYRQVLRGTGSSPGDNAFVQSGFVCPDGLTAESLREQIDDTASSILQSELARSTVELLLSTPANQIAEVTTWTSSQLPRYLNCSAQIHFSGQLEYVTCSKNGNSAIDGIYTLWISFIGLAVCLTVAMFVSLLGVQVMRALDVWPLFEDAKKETNPTEEISTAQHDTP